MGEEYMVANHTKKQFINTDHRISGGQGMRALENKIDSILLLFIMKNYWPRDNVTLVGDQSWLQGSEILHGYKDVTEDAIDNYHDYMYSHAWLCQLLLVFSARGLL